MLTLIQLIVGRGSPPASHAIVTESPTIRWYIGDGRRLKYGRSVQQHPSRCQLHKAEFDNVLAQVLPQLVGRRRRR